MSKSFQEILQELVHKITMNEPDPLSHRQDSEKSPKRNMNKTNPFTDELGSTKQTEDDQKQQQDSFNDIGGWLPINAMRKRRLERKALFDTSLTVPGMGDPGQGFGAPWSGAGEVNPRDPEQIKKRDWSAETDKSRTQRLHRRNDPNRKIQQPRDYEEDNPGVSDLSSESVS